MHVLFLIFEEPPYCCTVFHVLFTFPPTIHKSPCLPVLCRYVAHARDLERHGENPTALAARNSSCIISNKPLYYRLLWSWWSSETMNNPSLCLWAKSLQSCLTLCDPVDCSPPDSSAHGVGCHALPPSQASNPRLLCLCIGRWLFITSTTWGARSFLTSWDFLRPLPHKIPLPSKFSIIFHLGWKTLMKFHLVQQTIHTCSNNPSIVLCNPQKVSKV